MIDLFKKQGKLLAIPSITYFIFFILAVVGSLLLKPLTSIFLIILILAILISYFVVGWLAVKKGGGIKDAIFVTSYAGILVFLFQFILYLVNIFLSIIVHIIPFDVSMTILAIFFPTIIAINLITSPILGAILGGIGGFIASKL